MSRTTHFLKRFTALAVIVFLGSSLPGCSFDAVYVDDDPLQLCTELNEIEYGEVVAGPPALVFEDPGTIIVLHGSGRATNPTGSLLRVRQEVALPAYATQATVFLNGWNLRFTGGDQRLAHVAAALARIRVGRGTISWDALGNLSDDAADEAFEFTYHYTIVAWNHNRLSATVDHNDVEDYCRTGEASGADNAFYGDNYSYAANASALTAFTSFLHNPAWTSGTVAVLPRGFGFSWKDWGKDRNVLQIAYNLQSAAERVFDHSQYSKINTRIQPLPDSPDDPDVGEATVGEGFVSWKTEAIYKDDQHRQDYRFAEIVSGLGGADVGVIQPPYSILPRRAIDYNILPSNPTSADIAVRNVPYDYAIPVLTGWEVGYVENDEQLRQAGIWLDNLRYERPAGGQLGTMRYRVSSIVADDSSNVGYRGHRVAILGLRRVTPDAGVKAAGGPPAEPETGQSE